MVSYSNRTISKQCDFDVVFWLSGRMVSADGVIYRAVHVPTNIFCTQRFRLQCSETEANGGGHCPECDESLLVGCPANSWNNVRQLRKVRDGLSTRKVRWQSKSARAFSRTWGLELMGDFKLSKCTGNDNQQYFT